MWVEGLRVQLACFDGNQLLLLLVAVGLGFLVEDSFTTVYGLVRKKGTRLCHHLAERASACTSRRQGAA